MTRRIAFPHSHAKRRGWSETGERGAGAKLFKDGGLQADLRINLPIKMLRSFVAIVEKGSMLNACRSVFVTQSALSLQIKRLEELLQQKLFARVGRRLVPTDSGKVLLDYAKRVLALHDEALSVLTTEARTTPVRLGIVQDVAEFFLSDLLERFSASHPDAQIKARVGGSAQLLSLLEARELDVAIVYTGAENPAALHVAPMRWFGGSGAAGREVVPLIVLEEPCGFRKAAIDGLEAVGRPYRIALETPNLSSLRAAVIAQLGVTCRSGTFLDTQEELGVEAGLPELPNTGYLVQMAPDGNQVSALFAQLASDAVRNLPF